MINHTVFFWLKSEHQDQAEAFEAALTKLTTIDTIATASFGKPAATSDRPVTDHSWDYAIHFSFANMDDHDAYQVHPDHDVFIADCKDWWEKVIVYDTQS